MLRFKGDISLALEIAVAFCLVMLLVIPTYASNLTEIFTIKKTVHYYRDIDEKGTELAALLSSGYEISNMQLVGEITIKNSDESKLDAFTNILKKIHGENYNLIVSYPGGVFELYEKQGMCGTAVTKDIPELEWPTESGIQISSGFGYRELLRSCDCHGGIDIATPVGTEIYVVADGIVEYAGWQNKNNPKEGMGKYIKILHPNDVNPEFITYYAHLSYIEPWVSAGQRVKADQLIGKSGKTGYIVGTTGEHLHFEIRDVGSEEDVDSINPCPYFHPVPANCIHAKVEACEGKGVCEGYDYIAEIPIPGARPGKVKGSMTLEEC